MKYDAKYIKENLYSGIICDVLDQMGYRHQALSNAINPLKDDTVIWGPAFTAIGTEVYSMPEDPLTAQCRTVEQLGEGEIYVLVTRGNYTCALFGELFANGILGRKGAGVLLDGYARDIKALKEMNVPIFYRGTNPCTSKGRCEINQCQLPIQIDGVPIEPGDYIFGDIDGIAVIPKDVVDEVIDRSIETVKKEDEVREMLQNGASMTEAYHKNGAI